MRQAVRTFFCAGLMVSLVLSAHADEGQVGPGYFNVRAFGAKGDGATVDSPAINKAIEAAAAAGGGTVFLPAGTYLSFSIRLKSNITLKLGNGATLLAGDPAGGKGRYDAAEPNEWDLYQDYGHSHWQNSLIWGIGIENVAILGPGRIDGKGLTRQGPGARRPSQPGDVPLTLGTENEAERALAAAERRQRAAEAGTPQGTGRPDAILSMDGQANKAIALKLSRNVTLRDLTIFRGGHFAILSSGVDQLTIDNLRIDTNRDGINVDSCRNVRISNTIVNSPNDDAIVLKSSFGLGYPRPTENLTITNCQVSGFDLGTTLDGTYGRTQERAPDRDGPTGRIKLGTESNGGFRNITISNCTFERSRGLALETVDGGWIEDIVVTNLVMRDIVTAPLFIRLGNRARGPEGTPVAAVRRVSISNVSVVNADPRYASILAGIPGHPLEDVQLSNIKIVYQGGGTKADAALEPQELETAYPEPSMFGTIPAFGLFARHVKNLALRDVEVSFAKEELRPALVLSHADGVTLDRVQAPRVPDVPFCVLRDVRDLTLKGGPGVPDTQRELVERDQL
jgi:polygalacturonase